MENNRNDFSGQNNPDNQNRENRNWNQNDPNQRDMSKFEQDSDDFTHGDDNLDGAMNISTGDYTGSESSSTLADQEESLDSFSTDDMDEENRNKYGMNDRGRSQITNADEADDDLSSDWNSRNL